MKKYLPDLFDDDFDVFPDLFARSNPLFGHHEKNLMKTDIRDMKDHYEMLIDLPGFKKDELHLELDNGYLTISAEKGLDKDEKDKNDKYIRRERYAGSMSRSFYVGEGVKEEDIHAKYENGILKMTFPKEETKKEVEEKKFISID